MISLSLNQTIAFAVSALIIIIFSRHVALKPKSHGFPRMFGWIGIAWLLVNNYNVWFDDFFSTRQIFAMAFLLYATYLIIAGIILIKVKGKAHGGRKDDSLFSFERTTELVTSGLYKYIRHPLYGSLVFLTWGIFLKNPEWIHAIVALISSSAFFVTMFIEEKENIAYFGEKYREYMKRSKMIIPFLL